MKIFKKNSPKNILSWLLLSAVSVFILTGCPSTDTEPVVSYNLTSSSIPEEGGTISFSPQHDSGVYTINDKVNVTAEPKMNWVFDRWEGDLSGSQNPETIIMNSDKMIRARFVPRDYPLTITITGEGSVDETIVQTKMTDYGFGTNVQLEAIPATGWNFLEWQDDLQGSQNPETIVIDAAKTVTAVFDQAEFNVQVSAEGPGTASVNPEKESYVYNETVQFSAVPNTGNQFLGWFNESGSFEMLDANFEYQVMEDLDITAFFNSVEGAFVVVTASISSTDGTVDMVVFHVFNYLLNSIVLIGADVENEEGEEVATLRFGTPPAIASRSGLEVQAGFDGEDAPDVETLKSWIFKWLFDFEGERYEKGQQVGEPDTNAKEKALPLENIRIGKSISVSIE